jgi:hypothetical protein
VSYTYAELEALWVMAGGPTAEASTAAAIAEAESGGNALAAYPGTTVQPGQGTGSDATGLWQILGLPNGNFTLAQLTIPLDNAKMAVAKYEQAGNSFVPWQTYTSGAYEQFLQSGVSPATSVPGANSQGGTGAAVANTGASAGGSSGTGDTALGGLLDIPSQMTGFFSDADTFLNALMWLVQPSSWVRIGAFLAGVALLLFAIHALIAVGEGEPLLPKAPSVVPIPV